MNDFQALQAVAFFLRSRCDFKGVEEARTGAMLEDWVNAKLAELQQKAQVQAKVPAEKDVK